MRIISSCIIHLEESDQKQEIIFIKNITVGSTTWIFITGTLKPSANTSAFKAEPLRLKSVKGETKCNYPV
jgi:hypothetical protein